MNNDVRKICFVTGTRADYGIMSRLMSNLHQDPAVELQIVATNMHLSPIHGMTVGEIESDGLPVDYRVPMNRTDDSPRSIVSSMGDEMKGMAQAFDRLKPDLIVILGDRYEMLVAASAALLFHIPVAHLYGGEVTEGAIDDAIRNAITMLSSYHFTSTALYRDRLISMGIDSEHVFHIGALGADNISRITPMTLSELEKSIEFQLGEEYLLVTFHPVTLEPGEAVGQTRRLLKALEKFIDRYKILITMPNSDSEGDAIASEILIWAQTHPKDVKTVASLGRERYYAALAHASAVVGNSSSGLTEAPSFGIPTVNIGNRQKGRAFGSTVIHCPAESTAIIEAIDKALTTDFKKSCALNLDNPYSFPDTLPRLHTLLTSLPLH